MSSDQTLKMDPENPPTQTVCQSNLICSGDEITPSDSVLCETCNGHILDCSCFTGLYHVYTQTLFCQHCNGEAELLTNPSGTTTMFCRNSQSIPNDCKYCCYCDSTKCECCYFCNNISINCTCCKTCGDLKDECCCGLCRNCSFPEGDIRCICDAEEEYEKEKILSMYGTGPSPRSGTCRTCYYPKEDPRCICKYDNAFQKEMLSFDCSLGPSPFEFCKNFKGDEEYQNSYCDYEEEKEQLLYDSSFGPSPCEDCRDIDCRGC